MEIIQEICKEGKSKKKEQKICLLSKIKNIKEKEKKNKNKKQKTKNKKKYKHLSPSKCLHETKCDGVPNHATPPTPA